MVVTIKHPKKCKTAKECLTSVRKNGMNIMYMEKQIPKVCLAAVKQNGYAIMHIKEPSFRVCVEAVNCVAGAINYIDIDTFDEEQKYQLCLAAVEKDGMMLAIVEKQGYHNDEIRKVAITQNCLALTCIEAQTAELSLFAFNISREQIEQFIRPEFYQFCIDNCEANKRFRLTKRAE